MLNAKGDKVNKKYVIALDAGTTSVRAFVYDTEKKLFVHGAQQEVSQSFPQSGWVEQDANEIYYKAAYVLNDCISYAGAQNVAGIGIANQRETVVLWDKTTGEPAAPAVVWQCRRTSAFCAAIERDVREKITSVTGLVPDAYFSASKIKWLLDHCEHPRRLLKQGRLCAGTVDSYLLYKFTGEFATDYTNASRTMLFDIRKLCWDNDLCDYFSVSPDILPQPKPCDARFGVLKTSGADLPVAGVLGDQQAALFGQACLHAGEGKITYGTGLFLLFHTGDRCVRPQGGLLSTIGCAVNGKVSYALEGSAFNAGSCVQWLRDGLGFFESSAESERLARSVENSGGVYFVPAFTGLGAPHWDADARALFCGITRGTTRAHMTRAVLESIAFSAKELADCMERDSGLCLACVRCDGGASANDFLMQFQSDVLGAAVDRPVLRESTALGAAYACALSLGLADEEGIAARRVSERVFKPSPDRERYAALYREYKKAVARALN